MAKRESDFIGCDFEKCYKVTIMPRGLFPDGVGFEVEVNQLGRISEKLYTLLVSYDELPLALENVGEFLILKFKNDKTKDLR